MLTEKGMLEKSVCLLKYWALYIIVGNIHEIIIPGSVLFNFREHEDQITFNWNLF